MKRIKNTPAFSILSLSLSVSHKNIQHFLVFSIQAEQKLTNSSRHFSEEKKQFLFEHPIANIQWNGSTNHNAKETKAEFRNALIAVDFLNSFEGNKKKWVNNVFQLAKRDLICRTSDWIQISSTGNHWLFRYCSIAWIYRTLSSSIGIIIHSNRGHNRKWD